jgi:hypothetical protein
MATRAQAKAAIDAIVADAKAGIDFIPVGANITDGQITFAPSQWTVRITAVDETDQANIESGLTTALTGGGKIFVITRQRRRVEGRRGVTVTVGLNSYLITL